MGLGLRPRSPTRPPSGPHGSPRGPTGLPRAKNPAGGFRKYDPPAGSLRVPGGRVVNTHSGRFWVVLGRNGPFLTIFMVFLGCFWPFFLHSLLGVKIAIFDQKTQFI